MIVPIMRFKTFSTAKICRSFSNENDFEIKPDKTRIIPASKRFVNGLEQYLGYEQIQEESQLHWLKRTWKTICFRFKSEDALDEDDEEIEEKLIEKKKLITDYDAFRKKMKDLFLQNNEEKRKEAGLLAEKYLVKYPYYKTLLSNLEEKEYVPFYFAKEENKEYIPEDMQLHVKPEF